jgi:hypothetical protein
MTEIEVTPEMIDAGVDCLFDMTRELLGPSPDELRAALAAAYRAMAALSPEQRADDDDDGPCEITMSQFTVTPGDEDEP